MRPFWIWRRHAIPTLEIRAYSLTPVVQLVGLRWPGGGWLCQFPLAVEVKSDQEENGAPQRLPIPDPTRTVVWFLFALALVGIMITILALRQQRQQKTRIGNPPAAPMQR